MDIVACVAVNDAFVLDAWGKDVGADGKVLLLADGSALFTKVKLQSPPHLPISAMAVDRTQSDTHRCAVCKVAGSEGAFCPVDSFPSLRCSEVRSQMLTLSSM